MPKVHTKALQRLINEYVSDPRRGCEVGVWTGHNSFHLLRQNKNLTLWMVDNYQVPDHRDWPRGMPMVGDMDSALIEALRLTDEYQDRRRMLICDSVSASAMIQHESLDFVYLDGSHQHKAVERDLGAWYRKVKPGGLLAGHDYDGRFSVKDVVDPFAELVGCTIQARAGRVWGMRKE